MNITMNNSYILIDMEQVRANIRTILSQLPAGTSLIPVLKDNAYGLGLEPVAKVLMEFPQIDMIAVSHMSEGAALRQCGFTGDILVLGGTAGFLLSLAVEHRLTLALGRLGLVPQLAEIARKQGAKAKVQVKIETGLHRIGLMPGAELDQLVRELRQAGDCLSVTGAFTHFANLDDPERTEGQFEAFTKGVEQLEAMGIPVPMRHISGSAASELYPEYALDGVRIGRRLYMDHPTRPLGDIREAASWRTFITNLRELKAGDQLGYGGHCVLDHDAVVATIGVGYGDGLNTALAECRAPVLVGGMRGKLLACCMDQSMIEVTGIPCNLDDEVTLFGYDSQGNFLSSQEVALLIGDNEGCGLISDLSPRVARIYQGL